MFICKSKDTGAVYAVKKIDKIGSCVVVARHLTLGAQSYTSLCVCVSVSHTSRAGLSCGAVAMLVPAPFTLCIAGLAWLTPCHCYSACAAMRSHLRNRGTKKIDYVVGPFCVRSLQCICLSSFCRACLPWEKRKAPARRRL